MPIGLVHMDCEKIVCFIKSIKRVEREVYKTKAQLCRKNAAKGSLKRLICIKWHRLNTAKDQFELSQESLQSKIEISTS